MNDKLVDFSSQSAASFSGWVREMMAHIGAVNEANGWRETKREDGTIAMLIVTEVAELVEAQRKPGQFSEHIPAFSAEEEEAADIVIRVMDAADMKGWRLGEAIAAKVAYNKTRGYKHGGKAF